MKSKLSILLLIFIGTVSNLQAQLEPRKMIGEPFKLLDTDGDNRVSEREYIGGKTGEERSKAKKEFRRRDRNNDKSLQSKEYKQEGLWERPHRDEPNRMSR